MVWSGTFLPCNMHIITHITHTIYRSIGLGSVALSEYDLLGEALEENKSTAGGVGANVLPLLQVSVLYCCVS